MRVETKQSSETPHCFPHHSKASPQQQKTLALHNYVWIKNQGKKTITLALQKCAWGSAWWTYMLFSCKAASDCFCITAACTKKPHFFKEYYILWMKASIENVGSCQSELILQKKRHSCRVTVRIWRIYSFSLKEHCILLKTCHFPGTAILHMIESLLIP